MRGILHLLLSVLLISAFLPFRSAAQSEEQIRAILYLTGAGSLEELEEQEVERYCNVLGRPFEVNRMSRAGLVSCGVMTPYQAASLSDYKSRNGDVLSFAELEAVDGFGKDYVMALRPFISLGSVRAVGETGRSMRISQDAVLKGGLRDGVFCEGGKYRLKFPDMGEASFAVRNTYTERTPSYTFNATLQGKRVPYKVIVGDYSARFGQGLCVWSGFSLSGFSGSSSFVRRATGISPSWSYSRDGSHRGVAGSVAFGRIVLSAFTSLEGLREKMETGKGDVNIFSAANVRWLGRNWEVGMTGTREKVSADCRWTIRGNDLFAETAWDIENRCIAGVAGAVVNFKGDWKLASALRCYPACFGDEYAGGIRSWTKTSDEYAVSLGTEVRGFVFTADAARKADENKYQWKFLLQMPFGLSENMILSVRATERIRPYEKQHCRTDARCDLEYSSSGISPVYGAGDGAAWMWKLRVNGLLCKSLGILGYVEGGRKTDVFSTYLRGTVFRIDNWDDRIYSYERDAPGNFSVPAYYGRGVSFVWTGSCKLRLSVRPARSLKIYLKASSVKYFKVQKSSSERTDRNEIKMQLVFDL